jgi:Mrp family chromosome partitioning ATPase
VSPCQKQDFSVKPNELSKIHHIIGILSGKGGVGKSIVTSMLAVPMKRRGFQTAFIDADLTGPSIPKMFGAVGKARISGSDFYPIQSRTGIKLMSINFLLDNESDPVVWRGPLLGKVVKQFWANVIWSEVDFMFIDMPPGTGDVPLTVFQSIKMDGIIIVTSPQDLVSMIVSKAVKMAQMMGIPILGIIENMSYFECPECHKIHQIFGESHIEKVAETYNLNVLGKLPLRTELTRLCDQGEIEDFEGRWMDAIADGLENNPPFEKTHAAE